MTVGLPYFLLSTTGPLLQAWYAQRFRAPCLTGCTRSRMPLHGRAAELPVLFEPVFTTHQQAWMWSAAYGGVFVVAVRRARFARGPGGAPAALVRVGARAGGRSAAEDTEAVSHRRKIFDVADAAGGSLGCRCWQIHQSSFAERCGHSVPVGAAAEHLPADVHPVL